MTLSRRVEKLEQTEKPGKGVLVEQGEDGLYYLFNHPEKGYTLDELHTLYEMILIWDMDPPLKPKEEPQT